ETGRLSECKLCLLLGTSRHHSKASWQTIIAKGEQPPQGTAARGIACAARKIDVDGAHLPLPVLRNRPVDAANDPRPEVRQAESPPRQLRPGMLERIAEPHRALAVAERVRDRRVIKDPGRRNRLHGPPPLILPMAG